MIDPNDYDSVDDCCRWCDWLLAVVMAVTLAAMIYHA